jgi:hypothetical protein
LGIGNTTYIVNLFFSGEEFVHVYPYVLDIVSGCDDIPSNAEYTSRREFGSFFLAEYDKLSLVGIEL